MPKLTLYATADEFLAEAGEALYQNEALNSLILGIVQRLVENPQQYGEYTPLMCAVHEGDQVVLAAAMTPPYGLLLAPIAEDVTEAMVLLLETMLEQDWPLPDVNATKAAAGQFARMWAARTGGEVDLEMAERLYILHEVTMPQDVPGEMVEAGPEHLNLVTQWMSNFEVACFGESRPLEKIRPSVEQRIEQGNWHLWMLDGEPVSMCMYGRPIRSTCAISGVYTPPEHRRHGYAGACVAALTQKMLDQGYTYTNLFTDLANPTSNSVYMKIGYEPVADFDKYVLKK